jgi:hypothetical protein
MKRQIYRAFNPDFRAIEQFNVVGRSRMLVSLAMRP